MSPRALQDRSPTIEYDANGENPHLDLIFHDFTELETDSGVAPLRFVALVHGVSVFLCSNADAHAWTS